MPRPAGVTQIYFAYGTPRNSSVPQFVKEADAYDYWWDPVTKTVGFDQSVAGGGQDEEFIYSWPGIYFPIDQVDIPAGREAEFNNLPAGHCVLVYADNYGGVYYQEVTRLKAIAEPVNVHRNGTPGSAVLRLTPVLPSLASGLTATVSGKFTIEQGQAVTAPYFNVPLETFADASRNSYHVEIPDLLAGHYACEFQVSDQQHTISVEFDIDEDINLLEAYVNDPADIVKVGSGPGKVTVHVRSTDHQSTIRKTVRGYLSASPSAVLTPEIFTADDTTNLVFSNVFAIVDPGTYYYTIQVSDGQPNLTGSVVVGRATISGTPFSLGITTPVATESTKLGQATGKIKVELTVSGGDTQGEVSVDLTRPDNPVPATQTAVTTDGLTYTTTFADLPAGYYPLLATITNAPQTTTATAAAVILPPPLQIGDQLSFVPWVQPQLMHDAEAGTGPRPTLKLGVRLLTDQLAEEDLHTAEGQIYGPADVLGINQRAILGTTPVPGASGFSPLQLVAIEFNDEDLPWRYSTRKVKLNQDTVATPLPWLQLLVLEAGEYDALQLTGQALPGIQLQANVPYPNVADNQQALWAHVQLNGSLKQTGTISNEQPTAGVIQTFVDQAAASPALAYSRIFCPRRLKADTAYRAFLVPALEVSRLTGLGQDTSGVMLDEVADPTKDGKFPVYFQWQFSTGTEEDFESLLGQLHQANAATSTASASILGMTLPTAPATTYQLPMPSLLTDEQAPALATPPLAVASYLYQQLAPSQGTPGVVTPRPLVTPPLYGRAYMVSPTLLAPTADAMGTAVLPNSWKHTINLDPRYRAIAALGTQVVQANQEEYVRRAWDQVQDVLLANERLRGLQYSLRTTASLRAQHLPLNTLTTTTTSGSGNFAGNRLAVSRLSTAVTEDSDLGSAAGPTTTTSPPALADYGLHLTSLALSRVKLTASQAPAELTGLTVREALRRSSTPLAAFSPTFRRIIKPFGNYMIGQAGRPLRPTEPEAADPITVADPRALRGTSLRQRDGLLSALSGGEATAAGDRAQQVRAYQFEDAQVDLLLAKLSEPEAPALAPAGLSGSALLGFNAAFSQFKTINADTIVGFIKPQHVRPPLPLAPVKGAVVTGTQPGPLVTVKIKTVAPAMPLPVVYSPGDFEGQDYNATEFYVGNYDEPDWAYQDFSAADFNVGEPPVENPAVTASGQHVNRLAALRITATATTTTTSTTGAPVNDTLPVIQQAKAFPVFKDPMGEPLRQLHPELFVPGLGDFPAGGVAELQVNQAFIEAYMVGLNHALGSELHWRGFPVELRGTFFQQFWDVSEHFNATLPPGESPTAEQEQALLDIAPLDCWIGNPLGQNTMTDHGLAVAPPAPLRLALRSELLRRYPTLVVGLQPAGSDGPSDDLTQLLLPRQRLAVGQDVSIVIFDKSLQQAKADGDYLLLLERPGQPTFGLDELPAGGDASAAPLSWNDLTWDYLGTPYGDVITINQAGPNQPHATAEPGSVAYLTDSANLAYALFQEPILAALPLETLFS